MLSIFNFRLFLKYFHIHQNNLKTSFKLLNIKIKIIKGKKEFKNRLNKKVVLEINLLFKYLKPTNQPRVLKIIPNKINKKISSNKKILSSLPKDINNIKSSNVNTKFTIPIINGFFMIVKLLVFTEYKTGMP